MSSKRIGFVGAGQMAKALGSGIAATSGEIRFAIFDPSETACQSFMESVGSDRTEVVSTNQQVFNRCDCVFLAVKPQFLREALEGVDAVAAGQPLVVSVIAGVSLNRLRELGKFENLIRVMPNTPCLIGMGASAMSVGKNISQQQRNRIRGFMESVGEVVEVPESQLDSVTGLSGSGPAFVFTFIESLVEGGVLTGLPRRTAVKLAVQTVLGAATLVKETGDHPAVLRDQVTSPGGTTIAGLKALEQARFRDAVMSAIAAATDRAREIGRS